MFVILMINLISMLICVVVASVKNLNKLHWFLYGALVGPLAIPFVFFVRSRTDNLNKEL